MVKKTFNTQKVSLITTIVYFVYLFFVWSFYRMNFKFSDILEELYIKPIIWLLPFLYIIPYSRIRLTDLGISFRNIFPSIYLSIGLGTGFTLLGFVSNVAKYGRLNFGANIGELFLGTAVLISFATALTEEFVFRGYLLGLLLKKYKSTIIPVLVSSIVWTTIHIPITNYVWGMDSNQMVLYLTLTFIYGLGASLLFIRTRNLASSIFLHVLWEWPVILFR